MIPATCPICEVFCPQHLLLWFHLIFVWRPPPVQSCPASHSFTSNSVRFHSLTHYSLSPLFKCFVEDKRLSFQERCFAASKVLTNCSQENIILSSVSLLWLVKSCATKTTLTGLQWCRYVSSSRSDLKIISHFDWGMVTMLASGSVLIWSFIFSSATLLQTAFTLFLHFTTSTITLSPF